MKIFNSFKKSLRKKKEAQRQMRKVDRTIATAVRSQYLQNKALHNHDPLTQEKSDETTPELVISLTTYSKRIHDVHLVIESLGEQSIQANRIILWLDEEEFTQSSIPEILKRQQKRGLEVRFCPNYRSYKKLIPTVELLPEANIITVDDDLLYPYDLIELLLKEHALVPNAIVGIRSHEMNVVQGELQPYKSWSKECSFESNSEYTFLTTGAGTLFPAGLLPNEAKNKQLFLELCPNADDIWINLVCYSKGIKRVKIMDDRNFASRFCHLEDHQDLGLNKHNVNLNHNDKQAHALIKHFNIELQRCP
ncbi:hypothetical protein [Vibrio sinaloensis]|uniref:hypothetical protein n=1 Tax=Photobacterium sp. (strain ATCC 43367) TaxID=379097 RepID=UPI000694BCB1|nr:hypothetical protein [Vibrio sinaloensis]